MATPRYAAIDVGSNTLRLLIAEQAGCRSLRPLRVERRITRLGERFLPSRRLLPEAMSRSVAALREFAALMAELGVNRYLAGATAVVREAGNREEFLRMVEQEAGIRGRLLSDIEEARLSLLGAASVIPATGEPLAMFDIGGGSTELIWTSPEESNLRVESVSLPLGVVHLTETFLEEDPPGPAACARLAGHVSGILQGGEFPAGMEQRLWVGTAGTVTTLASMRLRLRQYDPELISGTILERQWLAGLCQSLALMPVAHRRELPGLESGREDIILAGGLIALELMNFFEFSRFRVSDAGLLEGLFFEVCRSPETASEQMPGAAG